MTVEELANEFNNKFQLEEWPETYEVDFDTYGRVSQFIINYQMMKGKFQAYPKTGYCLEEFWIGLNNGILFKGVELIPK